MRIKLLLTSLLLFSLFSCEFKKSAHKDLITGLSTKGNGLSCDQVYLSDGEDKISRNSFTYGEKFHVNFENIEGFKREGTYAFPGMQLLIINQAGDTVMQNNDLYDSYVDGMEFSPLLLHTDITVAKPMHSTNSYTLFVNIWDKKGEGTYKSQMDFDVISNKKIEIENNNISYNDIYLFSEENKMVITNNNVKLNEDIYMIFEGLSGFSEEAGQVLIGLSIKAKDSEGTIILNEEDLIGEASMEISKLKSQLAPTFIFTGTDIKNPVACEITIWDKKSDRSIKASVNLKVE